MAGQRGRCRRSGSVAPFHRSDSGLDLTLDACPLLPRAADRSHTIWASRIERRFECVSCLKPEAEIELRFDGVDGAGQRLMALAVLKCAHCRRKPIGGYNLLRRG